MPSTPAFVMTPDKTALAGAGATGWAVGSHPCIGNIPAFVPKPTIIKNTANSMMPGGLASLIMPPGEKYSTLPSALNRKNPKSTIKAPATE